MRDAAEQLLRLRPRLVGVDRVDAADRHLARGAAGVTELHHPGALAAGSDPETEADSELSQIDDVVLACRQLQLLTAALVRETPVRPDLPCFADACVSLRMLIVPRPALVAGS